MVKKNVIFPFNEISNDVLLSLFSDHVVTYPKSKCSDCKKRTKVGASVVYCCECHCCFHLTCAKINKNKIPLSLGWICQRCVMNELPFSSINDENMKLTNHGLSDDIIDSVVDKCPSFSIKSLLDQMPGQKIDTDQFMSSTILSKYYTASDFLYAKFSNKNFSIFHLNISSLKSTGVPILILM